VQDVEYEGHVFKKQANAVVVGQKIPDWAWAKGVRIHRKMRGLNGLLKKANRYNLHVNQ
jgi:hypothetical protein